MTSDAGHGRALLHGWLKEVNWDKGTAQLHDVMGGFTRLVFDSALSQKMQRLATQFVEVRGSGRFNADDDWASVQVDSISGTPSGREPFDLDAVLNEPNPRLFDPDRMVTASEPFVVRQAHYERGCGSTRSAEDCEPAHHERGAAPSASSGRGLRQAQDRLTMNGGRVWGAPRAEDPSPVSGEDAGACLSPRRGEEGTGLAGGRGHGSTRPPSTGSGQADHERGCGSTRSAEDSGPPLRQAQDRLTTNGGVVRHGPPRTLDRPFGRLRTGSPRTERWFATIGGWLRVSASLVGVAGSREQGEAV